MSLTLHHKTEEGFEIGCLSNEDCGDLCYIEWAVRVGRRQETSNPDEWEMAHLLEHVIGSLTSKKYPCAEDLIRYLEQRAIYANANVTDDVTQFWLKGPRSLAPLMLDILLSALMEFQLEDEKVIEREVKAVINELSEDEDNVWSTLIDELRLTLSQLIPIRLRKKNLLSTPPREIARRLWEFKRKWYRPGNSTLLLLGRDMIDLFQSASERIEKWSATFPLGGREESKPFVVIPKDQMRWISVDNVQQVNILYCIQGSLVSLQDESRKSFQAIAMALGMGLSSRLMQKLRTELSIVYNVSADCQFHPFMAQQSVFIIETLLQERYIDQVLHIILNELKDIKSNGLRSDELTRWENKCKAKAAHRQVIRGDLDMLSKKWGKWIHWGCQPDNWLDVTADSVFAAAQKLLGPEGRHVIFLGGNFTS